MKRITFTLLVFSVFHIAYSQVGVGTTNPQAILHIDGKSDNAPSGVPAVSEQANDVVVTSDGRVGIGTVAPNSAITIKGNGSQSSSSKITFDGNNLASGNNQEIQYINLNNQYNLGMDATSNGYYLFHSGLNGATSGGMLYKIVPKTGSGSRSEMTYQMDLMPDGDYSGAYNLGSTARRWKAFLNQTNIGRHIDSGPALVVNSWADSNTKRYIAEFMGTDAKNNSSNNQRGILIGINDTDTDYYGEIMFHSRSSVTNGNYLSMNLNSDPTKGVNVTPNGNTGVGTINPTVRLEVNGSIKIGDSAVTTPTEGTIRYNSTTKKFQGYDGTNWVDFN